MAQQGKGSIRSSAVAITDGCIGFLAALTVVRVLIVQESGDHWRSWIDLSFLPALARVALFLAFGAGVLLWTWLPKVVRPGVRWLVFAFAAICLYDAWRFHRLVQTEALETEVPISMSLLTALLLLVWALWASAPGQRPPSRQWVRRVVGVTAVTPVAIAAFVWLFGSTDYRRPADAVVVFGAAVYQDGTPSLSLDDRTRTACQLVIDGYADWLVLSGGRGEGMRYSEPEVMWDIAVSMGVDESKILVDERGNDTRSTVRNAAELAREHRWGSLLMVSHDYHLARIKMFASRLGLRVYTVPAAESRPLRRENYFFARELAALGWYYLQPTRSI